MELRENLIICIGSPMIDVTARVTWDFLQKRNLKPNNAVSYNENYLNIFDDLEKFNPTFTVGGSITHTVKAIQNYLVCPGVCSYIGAVGTDLFGKEIHRKLKSENINVFFEEIDWSPTAKCAVLLFENNRSFVTDLAASTFLSHDFIERATMRNIISQGKYIYLSAFFYRVSCPIVQKICSYSKLENKVFIFNVGAPFLCLQYAKEFKQTLPYVNILIGNAEEAIQLGHVLGCPHTDIEAIARFLHKQLQQCHKSDINETLVIITRGDRSIILANTDGIMDFQVPVLQVADNLNTSGAGDYFVGGFLANYILKKPIGECIVSGIRLSQKLIVQNN